MSDAGFHFEAKKYSLRQAKDGVVVSFVVHPNDVRPELLSAPIGQHYIVALAPYTEEEPAAEAPKAKEPPAADAKPKERWADMKRAKQAGILCGRADFQAFLGVRSTFSHDMTAKQREEMRVDDTARHLRERLRITSRRQIDENAETASLFDALVMSYREATGQETEERG